MDTESQQRLKSLLLFLANYGDIPYALPGSERFLKFRDRSAVYNPAIPLAIVRPQNTKHVALLVENLYTTGVPFVIRSGGNNLFGQSMVHGAVIIDMRDISYCSVHEDRKSARIGGGIFMQDLVTKLEASGLSTATGTVPWIGFTGWSTYGGYGPFSGKYGMGYEQIIGAKMVNYKGEIIEADHQLLRGIKGAGGCFGVIVELKIKTYPLKPLLCGNIIFENTDPAATVKDVLRGIEKLRVAGCPPELCVAPLLMNTPSGMSIFCHVVWSDEDLDTGAKWVKRVTQFSRLNENQVRKSTHAGATQDFDTDFAPREGAYGSVNTLSIRYLTKKNIQVIARNIQKMPAQFGTGLAVHVAPRGLPESRQGSVFAAQEPHYMLEFLHGTLWESAVESTKEWADKFLAEMQGTDTQNILQSTYINLTPPGRNTLEGVFGEHYSFVKSLKDEHDPKGVFNSAAPFCWER